MARYDWNKNGRKDPVDSYIEYNMYKDFKEKQGQNSSYKPPENDPNIEIKKNMVIIVFQMKCMAYLAAIIFFLDILNEGIEELSGVTAAMGTYSLVALIIYTISIISEDGFKAHRVKVIVNCGIILAVALLFIRSVGA